MPNIITEPLLTLNAQGGSGNYFQSADQTNRFYRSLTLFINISVGGTLLPVVLGKDPLTGLYFPIAASPSALAVGQYVLNVSPSIAQGTLVIGGGSIANGTEINYPGYLPAVWAVGATTASSAVTATINGSLSD